MSRNFFRIGAACTAFLRPNVTKSDIASDDDVRKQHFGMWPEWSRQWNDDWDHRAPTSPADSKRKGKTIHLIMVRHGQYDLNTEENGLTGLGRHQAELTGKRIANMSQSSISDFYGERKIIIKNVYHSNLLRAVETARIVGKYLDADVKVEEDLMLAEGWPCLPEPYKDSSSVRPSKLFMESARIEAVFRKYCHRVTDGKKKVKAESDVTASESKETEVPGVASCGVDSAPRTIEEEYIVLTCHQNIIRYFVCRALQLHPEAWLRFRGSNCGITEIIISDDGRVSLEKFADVGHLPVDHHTFH